MIPLMKNAFLNEYQTKQELCKFIMTAERLSMGEKCEEFEATFAIKQGRKHAILFNSGGSANLALLQALKNLDRLKQDDNVGFSALTWSTNTMPIIQTGLVPVAIDCEVDTLNVSSTQLLNRLKTVSLKAFFITNALGFVDDIEVIRTICNERGIILIEDNCESSGTETVYGKTGNFGLASTFSFFVAHHMSTIEGGMICTDDNELAEMLKIVRANGWDRNLKSAQQNKWRKKYDIKSEFDAKYTFYDLGFNMRPTEITGFLGLYQLNFLDETIRKREENYFKIKEIAVQNNELITQRHNHINVLSTFAFPFVCKTAALRNKYLSQFSGAGIEIRPMIAGNMQKQPFYKKYVAMEFDLPNTDFLHSNSFYCGNYPELSASDIESISSCILT